MKKTELEKTKALKLVGQMRQSGTPGRFAGATAPAIDKREQRKLDQAQGLVPFAVKLHGDLIKQLQALAEQDGVTLNEVTDRVVRAGLDVPAKKVAKKAASKSATASSDAGAAQA